MYDIFTKEDFHARRRVGYVQLQKIKGSEIFHWKYPFLNPYMYVWKTHDLIRSSKRVGRVVSLVPTSPRPGWMRDPAQNKIRMVARRVLLRTHDQQVLPSGVHARGEQ